MIIEKLFRIIKNPALRNSWVVKSRILQEGLITCFLLYNSVASKTGLFKKRIGRSCGKRNVIDPHAVVASNNLILGNDCHICANVVLGPSTRIGDNVIIESGTIVGSEGFEIRRIGDRLIPVVHVGGVNICNNVVIGSHVCIDKSLSGKSTEISEHSWIGDYDHVAHGVRIGKHCTIASSVMIGGKVTIGDAV
ncbi:DapH/DapD/GlmU-related protein, partial [Methanoregula sp.]|uniref:DapH/DapD/GlmU-related protein n=1 Tax=Methanoregula sp. TaxID=2052170 RepID=UPI0026335FBB